MSAPNFKVTADFTKTFNETIKSFKNDAVLVGIPEAENTRDPSEQKETIGNAAILAINHFGSDEANIPRRPVLTLGIAKAQAQIADQFKKAAVAALKSGASALTQYYNRAGTIAANSCKQIINSQEGLAPPAASTLRARKYLTKSGFKGEKALLVTGQVRNSITYVLKGGDK